LKIICYLNQTNTVNTIEKIVQLRQKYPKKDSCNINDLSLKEETYLALLQKKEETLLNGASIDATVRVLDAQKRITTLLPKKLLFS
jgi:hypothetical protein